MKMKDSTRKKIEDSWDAFVDNQDENTDPIAALMDAVGHIETVLVSLYEDYLEQLSENKEGGNT